MNTKISASTLRSLISALVKCPNATVIIAPPPAWDLLNETLEMDCKSSAFTLDLRGEIADALHQLIVVEAE